MNPHLHQAMIASRTQQPALLADAAPLLSVLVAIAALVAFGATTVIA